MRKEREREQNKTRGKKKWKKKGERERRQGWKTHLGRWVSAPVASLGAWSAWSVVDLLYKIIDQFIIFKKKVKGGRKHLPLLFLLLPSCFLDLSHCFFSFHIVLFGFLLLGTCANWWGGTFACDWCRWWWWPPMAASCGGFIGSWIGHSSVKVWW